MNREAASRQINGFESNNEARATTAFRGVGFFRPGLRLNCRRVGVYGIQDSEGPERA